MQALDKAKVPKATRLDEIASVMCVASALYVSRAGDFEDAKQAFLKLTEIFYDRTVADMQKQGFVKEK